MRLFVWASALVVGVLSACGGGGSSSDTPAEVSISASTPAGTVPSGGSSQIVLLVRNSGSETATNVVVKPAFSVGVTPSAVHCVALAPRVCPTSVSLSSGSIVVGDLGSGGALSFTIDVSIAQDVSGVLSNTATVSADNDGSSRSKSSTVLLTVFAASPGPVNPLPLGLWSPANGATPSSGNYIYLESDSGEYIGQGHSYLYTPATANVTVSGAAGHLTVTVVGTESWNADFLAGQAVTQLAVGYYGSLTRYPFQNPVYGGLDWSGEGRGCNELSGWFVVDNVAYAGDGSVSAIDLRFAQNCENLGPTLYGKIHWVN